MNEHISRDRVYALLSFIILMTANSPFLKVYDLQHQFFLNVMLGLVCVITLCFNRFIFMIPLQVLVYAFTLYIYFPLDRFFGLRWLEAFYRSLTQSYAQILSGELSYLPQNMALVIILFFLFALAILLIHYQRIWLSYLMIISYLLLLVVLNQIQLGGPLILITCSAVLFYQMKRQPQAIDQKQRSKAFLISIVLLALTAGGSYLFQNRFPGFKDSLFTRTAPIRNYFNNQGLYKQVSRYGLPNSSKSGFSEDDQQLGGPLVDDPTILFTAQQSASHYWRVETKNQYSGKGWLGADVPAVPRSLEVLTLNDPSYQGPLAPATTIDITFDEPVPTYLPQPYGSTQVVLSGVETIETLEKQDRVNLPQMPKQLTYLWQEATYQIADLQGIPESSWETLDHFSEQEGATFFDENLALPITLPERVRTLAVELTQQHEGTYNKAKAVEQYLKSNRSLRYSKTDTPFTPEDQDYVDFFLFESGIGYCDNFSTSMVVLLRSVGIPSRWAKGFNSGEVIATIDGERKEYAIRNSHAHSWPEVYFEGYGWVPFEPTPSFNNPGIPVETTIESSSDVQESSTRISSVETSSSSQAEQRTSEASQAAESSTSEPSAAIGRWLPVMLGIAAFSGLVYALYRFAFVIRFHLYRLIRPTNFGGAYALLLRKAEKHLSRATAEPLNLYASRLEAAMPELDGRFVTLTAAYEAAVYGDAPPDMTEAALLLNVTADVLSKPSKEPPQ